MVKDCDFYTYHGARVLAGVIERYWRMRGYAGIKVERFEIPGTSMRFGLTSNIGPDGFPPR
jgi:hypothetical protein